MIRAWGPLSKDSICGVDGRIWAVHHLHKLLIATEAPERSRRACDASVKCRSNVSQWHFLTYCSVSQIWRDISLNFRLHNLHTGSLHSHSRHCDLIRLSNLNCISRKGFSLLAVLLFYFLSLVFLSYMFWTHKGMWLHHLSELQPSSLLAAVRFMPFSTTSFSENPQIRVKVQMLECKCYFVETWTFLWKWLPKKKKQFQAVTTPPHVLILFVFSSGGKKSMPQLLWWVVFKPASFKALLHSEPVYCSSLTFYCGGWPCHSFTDNCFLTMFFFPLPLKGERPILSRMLMPCKSRSEAELRGSKLPSLLFGWALLKNSIRVLNHRQKKHCLQCWWAFFSRNTKSFSVSWKGDICQVCTWQKI